MVTHGITHWDPDGCYGCQLKTKNFAPSCFFTTPGGRKAAQTNKSEKKLGKDLDAFKRIVVNSRGETMPPSTENAARMESECGSHYEMISGQSAWRQAKAKGRPELEGEWRRRASEAYSELQRNGSIDGHS